MAIKLGNNIFSFLSFSRKAVPEIPMNIGSPLDVVITKGPDAAEAPEFFRDPSRSRQEQGPRNPAPKQKDKNGSNRYSVMNTARPVGIQPIVPLATTTTKISNGNTSRDDTTAKKGATRPANTSSRVRKTSRLKKQQRMPISQRVRKSSVGRAAAAALARLNLSAAAASGTVKAPFLSPRTLKDSNKQFARLGVHLRTGSFENYRIRETVARALPPQESSIDSPTDPLHSPELPPVPPIPRVIIDQNEKSIRQNSRESMATETGPESQKEDVEEGITTVEYIGLLQQDLMKGPILGDDQPSQSNVALSLALEADPLEEIPQPNYSLRSQPKEAKEMQKASPASTKFVPESGSITDLRARRQAYQVRRQAEAFSIPRTSMNIVMFSENVLSKDNSARSPYEPYDIDAILAAYLQEDTALSR